MPWVDCPCCGRPKSAWEDSETAMFCGECEKKYQQSEADREESEARESEVQDGRP